MSIALMTGMIIRLVVVLHLMNTGEIDNFQQMEIRNSMDEKYLKQINVSNSSFMPYIEIYYEKQKMA